MQPCAVSHLLIIIYIHITIQSPAMPCLGEFGSIKAPIFNFVRWESTAGNPITSPSLLTYECIFSLTMIFMNQLVIELESNGIYLSIFMIWDRASSSLQVPTNQHSKFEHKKFIARLHCFIKAVSRIGHINQMMFATVHLRLKLITGSDSGRD